MIRQRLYNPAHLTPDELKRTFVARQDTLEELLRLIGEQLPGRPCQHMMLIGSRGMGKTTLGLRFLYAIGDNTELSEHWQPVAFHEESYGVVNLADFWVAALRHLTRATEENRWADRADALISSEHDTQRLAAYGLAAIMDFSQESGKRLILFVENIDTVFGQMQDEREIYELRATLMERPEILLLGSANAFFDAIGSYGQPLYEFFRIFKLDSVGEEDARRLLMTTAEREGRPEVYKNLSLEHGRLEIIRRLTGGNPRLLALACRMLIEAPLGSAMEDLERLIDEQTPYFKALVEGLPVQARKVFHCLSEGWRPMLAKEVAQAARLSSSHASAQLKQLLEKAYVREVRLRHEKRTRYDVADRFYNIYYLLRFSRTSRDRLERLVAFLHELFGPAPMRGMYPAAIEKPRATGANAEERSELLAVLAPHVADDRGFRGRAEWRHQAVELVMERLGPSAPVIKEIRDAFAGHPYESPVEESVRRAERLVLEGRLAEADASLREVIADQPHNSRARIALANVLLRQDRFEDAIGSLERDADCEGSGNPTQLRASLALRSEALFGMDRREEAVACLEKMKGIESGDGVTFARKAAAVTYFNSGMRLAKWDRYEAAIDHLRRCAELVHVHDDADTRTMAAEAVELEAGLLTMLNRDDDAIEARKRVTDYVLAEDSAEQLAVAVRMLSQSGDLLCKSGKYEEAVGCWREIASYIGPNDPPALRYSAAVTMASAGYVLIALERFEEAESVFGETSDIHPGLDQSWAGWALAIVCQGDAKRLSEAETFGLRAVQLNPRNSRALHTLSDVLAFGGRWTEALERLEQALAVGANELKREERHRLAVSLMRAAAAGQGQQVKRMMEESGLAQQMEPMWHAVRAELGEDLEPLPAEIMDAVAEVRRRISEGDGSHPRQS